MNKTIPSIKVPVIQKGITSKVLLSDELKGKNIIMFGVPGAFTPTCSEKHMLSYIKLHQQFIDKGIDDIYCLSVNDNFVMNAWLDSLGIEKVKPIADGNADFTRNMGMLVKKEAVCFGLRSHRYSMVVDNGYIEMIFVEQGKEDNYAGDPFDVSDATSMLNYLRDIKDIRREAIAENEATMAQQDDTETSTPE